MTFSFGRESKVCNLRRILRSLRFLVCSSLYIYYICKKVGFSSLIISLFLLILISFPFPADGLHNECVGG